MKAAYGMNSEYGAQFQTPEERAQAEAQKASTAQQGTTAADQFSSQPASTGGFTPAASPVTPDGQIRATTQEQYQAPVPAPVQAALAPQPTQQFAGNATGVQGQLPQAANAGQSAYGNYPARPANT